MESNSKYNQYKALRRQAEKILMDDSPGVAKAEKKDIYKLLHELNVSQTELEIQNDQLLQAQSEVEESRNKYVDLYEFAPVAYLTLNQCYIIEALNFAAAEMLGSSREAICKKSFLEFLMLDSRDNFLHHINQLFVSKIKQNLELQLCVNTNCYVQVQIVLSGKSELLIALTDITANKKNEIALQEMNNALVLINNLFQMSVHALAALDPELKFVVFNRAFATNFSRLFSVEVTKGMCLLNLFADYPEKRKLLNKTYAQALANKESSFICENKIDQDNYYYYEIKFSFISNKDSQYEGLMLSIVDITQFKLQEKKNTKRQAEIEQVARIYTMGETMSAIAHEINQPLTAITNYSHGCILKIEEGIKEAQHLLQILETVSVQATHAGEVIHRMKNFMREGKSHQETVDINEIVKDIVNMLAHENKILIDLDLRPLPLIIADRVQISQVILNLLRNSIEALQTAGEKEPKITIFTEHNTKFVRCEISDNGPGIAPELRKKILNSYFTTKAQGTGLGLTICRTLIEAHGGKLSYKPINSGACFQFALPLRPSK